MRCDKCKHWSKPTNDECEPEFRKGFGVCEYTPFEEDISEWRETDDDIVRALLPEYADRTALVQDGSGYNAVLRTKAGHFCAMFAAATHTAQE